MAILNVSKDEAFYIYESLQASYRNLQARRNEMKKVNHPDLIAQTRLIKEVKVLIEKVRPLK